MLPCQFFLELLFYGGFFAQNSAGFDFSATDLFRQKHTQTHNLILVSVKQSNHLILIQMIKFIFISSILAALYSH